MRKGFNPLKGETLVYNKGYHRIIIPVHIPNFEGYYADMFDVLKLCVNSLLRTIHNETLITIINNNSCTSISEYLSNLLNEQKIDRLVFNAQNKGKVDPVIENMRGCLEPLITVTDCDVLFKMGWQSAIENVYSIYPNVGFVSPLPQPQLFNYFTTWVWVWGILSNNIKRKPNKDLDSLLKFRDSINATYDINEIDRLPFTITYKRITTIIGSGHFCGTYNKNIIPFIPNKSSGSKFDGAEVAFFDEPIEKGGFLRLGTELGWVYHIGNKIEDWMYDVVEKNGKMPLESPTVLPFQGKGYKIARNRFGKFLSRIVCSKKLKKIKITNFN